MLEIEALLIQFHEQGIVMQEGKRIEIENLLKNSLFSSTMLLNLINDLLDLAKIENSSFNLNWNYFDLFDTVVKTADTLDSCLTQKNIKLTHEYREEDRPYFKQLFGDSHRYLQILLNFLSNAVKFTPNEGTIKI
jgi:signal transduction histidine kinase